MLTRSATSRYSTRLAMPARQRWRRPTSVATLPGSAGRATARQGNTARQRRGQAGLGVAGPGRARRGWARQGAAGPVQARHGMARLGRAGHGSAGQGRAWRTDLNTARQRRGMARRGGAWHGTARRGLAWRGVARQGLAHRSQHGTAKAWLGGAGHGSARRGKARLGMAWRGVDPPPTGRGLPQCHVEIVGPSSMRGHPSHQHAVINIHDPMPLSSSDLLMVECSGHHAIGTPNTVSGNSAGRSGVLTTC